MNVFAALASAFDGVAVVARHRAGCRGARLVVGHQLCRRPLERGRVVPLDLERVARLLCSPERRCEYCDPGGQLNDIAHARNFLRVLGTELDHLGAEARRMRNHGGEHVRKLHILRELGGAIRFCAGVGARHLLADVHEVLRILELDRRGNRLCRGIGRELAECRLLARGVGQHALLDRDRFRRHVPAFCRGADQHRACRGARLAQLIERVGHRRRTTGALNGPHQQVVVERGVGRRTLHPDLGPCGVHFVGHHSGQSSERALTHFEMLHQHGDGVVTGHANERVRLPRSRRYRARAALTGPGHLCEDFAREIKAEREPCRRARRGLQEPAPAAWRR